MVADPDQALRHLVDLLGRSPGDSGLCLDCLRAEEYLKALLLKTLFQNRGLFFYLTTMKYIVTKYLSNSYDDRDYPCCP